MPDVPPTQPDERGQPSRSADGESFVHRLEGCRPVPLASYLKALAVLRLVGGQKDPTARLHFDGDVACLSTVLSRHELIGFFHHKYRPTPIMAPWNGGSGFFPKDKTAAETLEVIERSSHPRLGAYRQAIGAAKRALVKLHAQSEKPSATVKPALIQLCRSTLPDDALDWIDAALVLVQEDDDPTPKYPPLLGTGGNDGRLEFTSNFMQRIVELLGTEADAAAPSVTGALIEASLFGVPTTGLTKNVVGQFMPGDAGGANASTGFDSDSLINAWDYVLMLEGAVLFAASAVRALEQTGRGMGFAYPFTVHPTRAGYASASVADNSRGELWAPLWHTPVSLDEARGLLSEGRARADGKRAKTGLDFARAAATLGVDRGIAAFQRYGFHVRYGKNHFAVPLSRVPVVRDARVELLDGVSDWLNRVGQAASNKRAPASVKRAARRLDAAIFALCEAPENQKASRALEVLVALGGVERQLGRSSAWAQEAYLRPVPPLDPAWLEHVEWSTEARLAAAAASVWAPHELRRRQGFRGRGEEGQAAGGGPDQGHRRALALRESLEPVELRSSARGETARWSDDAAARNEVQWREGPVVASLCAIVQRRLRAADAVRPEKQSPAADGGERIQGQRDRGRLFAPLADIADFVFGDIDDGRFADLLWGFSLLRWRLETEEVRRVRALQASWDAEDTTPATLSHVEDDVAAATETGPRAPPLLYALLRLAFSSSPLRRAGQDNPRNDGASDDGLLVPMELRIARLAASGQGTRAAELAARRLRISGLGLVTAGRSVTDDRAARALAALAFPVRPMTAASLLRPLQSAAPKSSPPASGDGPSPPPATDPSDAHEVDTHV